MPNARESDSATIAAAPCTSVPLPLGRLTAARPREGSPLSSALRRAVAERRRPGTVPAAFDNRLS